MLTGLGPHDAIVDDNFARDQDLKMGDTLRLLTPLERTATFRVVGTVEGELDHPEGCRSLERRAQAQRVADLQALVASEVVVHDRVVRTQAPSTRTDQPL